MFQINDYIMYGENGVCKVGDICVPSITGIDQKRTYYILHPTNSNGRTIYTPVDNDKVVMRRILTKEEAMDLINRIPYIESIWVATEKFREDYYKKAIRSFECEQWIKIIKTLYLRKKERISDGKTVTATDERYLKQAEDYLYGELSLALEIPKAEVENYIFQRVKSVEPSSLSIQ